MNHTLTPLGRLVMASRKESEKTENNPGVDFKQFSFSMLAWRC